MGLILKDSISKLIKGYPTVSDKYNVKGGVLEGSEALKFGQLIQFGTATGYYKPVSATSTIDSASKIAGIALATNVKLNLEFAGDKVEILPGEGFNVFVSGFIAVEITNGLTIKEGDQVYATSTGTFTNDEGSEAVPNYEIHGAKFTGIVDGTLAEIGLK